ncbi:MAG: ribosome biogenesis GTPase Der [Helicobacteraceae bacterium]|jgi:GTP-binding protein|nr:ribosome biogenesis GTPase Der [Helicobacteraceae bacterium]
MFKIALVGLPNVGKSTLFNRLNRGYDAIVSDVAGTTRDIRVARAVIDANEVEIVDTGGLENRDETFAIVRRKALETAKKADLALFLIDGQKPPDDEERKLFYELQKQNPSIALLLNKIDNDDMENRAFEYMSFGAKKLFTISCAHKRGLTRLEKWIGSLIKTQEGESAREEGENQEEAIRAAIIGRPNVGKSALLNALVGFERSVVSPIAGTTIDPVDEQITINGRKIVFIDTAGVRKRSRIEGIERFAFDRTEKALQKADVALIVLDCSEDFTELDERIAGLADKHKTAAILVLNKYDVARESYAQLEKQTRERFVFLSYAPIVTLSATSKKRVHKLADLITAAYENYSRRIPTSQLNELIEEATNRHKIPSDRGKAVKIYYAAQYGTKPPKISLVSNRPRSIHFSYLRYLANKLRENVDFVGTPIVIEAKLRQNTTSLK